MTIVRNHRSSPRRAFTLVELLVVCAIFVLVAAMAIPAVRPALANGKIREASRQLNAFISEAKAHAAARGRPVGLMIDRDSASREGARDPRYPFRMYLAEVPPPYSGDVSDAPVSVGTPIADSMAVNILSNLRPPETRPFLTVLDNSNAATQQPAHVRQLDFTDKTKVSMILPIVNSYLPSDRSITNSVPFSIRFNNSLPDYAGFFECNSATAFPQAFIVCPFGSQLHGSLPANSRLSGNIPFTIHFPPQRSSDSPLELPAGMVIDLNYSGYGRSGVEFNNSTSKPLILMFSTGGSLTLVHNGSNWSAPGSRIHFLIGSLKNAVEGSPADLQNPAVINDGKSIWVSIQSQTGNVITSDNVPGADVSAARALATNLDTKGGR